MLKRTHMFKDQPSRRSNTKVVALKGIADLPKT